MNKIILAAALVLGMWTGAKAQVPAYGDDGSIAGLDGIVVSGTSWNVRFYDDSVLGLLEDGSIPGDQVFYWAYNNPDFKAGIETLQHRLSEIVLQYGSTWIPGCLDTCLISSPVGYAAKYQVVWESSVIHNSVRTDKMLTGTLLDSSTVGTDHSIAIWHLGAPQ